MGNPHDVGPFATSHRLDDDDVDDDRIFVAGREKKITYGLY